jgi:hypothetical protein
VAGFVFFLVGAVTYSWHHVPPSWLAGCVLVGLLLSGQFSKQDFRRQIDWPMLFFLLGVDSITRVMDYQGLQAGLAASLAGCFQFVDGRIELFIFAALVTDAVTDTLPKVWLSSWALVTVKSTYLLVMLVALTVAVRVWSPQSSVTVSPATVGTGAFVVAVPGVEVGKATRTSVLPVLVALLTSE